MHKKKPYFARFLALLLSTTTVFGSVPVSASSVSGSSVLDLPIPPVTPKIQMVRTLPVILRIQMVRILPVILEIRTVQILPVIPKIQIVRILPVTPKIQIIQILPVIPRIQIHPIKTTTKKNLKFLIQKFILLRFRITVMPSCLRAMDTLE